MGRKPMLLTSDEDLGVNCTSSLNCAGGLVCVADNTTITGSNDTTSNITLSDTCQYCENNTQCEVWGDLYECNPSDSGHYCVHKDLWPLVARDYLVTALLLFGGMIAAGGGIGGGGVFIPVLILVGGFSPKHAIPLSNLLIGGASIANYIQMGPKRHPLVDRPLIDYNIALIMQPIALAGTILGVLFNQLFPDWLILGLLIIVLVVSVWRTGAPPTFVLD
eukprot:TRINITY_DN3023_c0_g1_i1.p1 TRINITY_DN3023_c0_g1~~TRINITY_DN3023_c0_g1_i1.p1  ORF type:complete len:241 (-),score=60.07 TRINITY_DN3023_c0_g1_i1:76-735(-)